MYSFQFRVCFGTTSHYDLCTTDSFIDVFYVHKQLHIRDIMIGCFLFWLKILRVNNENSSSLPLCCLPQHAIVTYFFKELIVIYICIIKILQCCVGVMKRVMKLVSTCHI
jgi:hypothetical protein